MSDLKQNYRLEGRIEVFYTGGTMRLSSDASKMACACHDEVKVRSIYSKHVFHNMKTLSNEVITF